MAARLLATAGAALVVGGFFLPWLAGAAEFGARDFSGLDLARLVRNFEIVASSSSESGGLRATAVVLYLAPALAINAAVMVWLPVARSFAAIATVVAGAYGAIVLVVTLAFSIVSWTELERVLGAPMMGFWITIVGVVALGASAALFLRQPPRL